MISQKMLLNVKDLWSITVNTEATEAGEKISSIPFSLYNTKRILLVDWGDGTFNYLTPNDYTGADATASCHEYLSAGVYNISIYNLNTSLYFLVRESSSSTLSLNNITAPLYYLRRTLISINNSLPVLSGTNNITENFPDRPIYLNYLFQYCNKLQFISENLLSKNKSFTRIGYFLYKCSALNDFVLHIYAPDITVVSNFCQFKENTSRIIYVPSGSTTETTFNSVASTLGLTIIGE